MNNRVNIQTGIVLMLAALLALVAGTVIYIGNRSGDAILFLQYLPQLDFTLDFLPRIIIFSAPSFLHVYAFSLLTGIILSATKQTARFVCLFWLGVELLFEIGQYHPIAKAIVALFPQRLNDNTWLTAFGRYFVHGTFDVLDILCLLLGAIAAYLSIIFYIPDNTSLNRKTSCP